jgi:exonuclease III
VQVVYGPANHDKSGEFLEELKNKCRNSEVPMVLGGDFNLIRGRADKSNSNINWNLVNLFNNFIADLQLQKLRRGGRRFTWTNK